MGPSLPNCRVQPDWLFADSLLHSLECRSISFAWNNLYTRIHPHRLLRRTYSMLEGGGLCFLQTTLKGKEDEKCVCYIANVETRDRFSRVTKESSSTRFTLRRSHILLANLVSALHVQRDDTVSSCAQRTNIGRKFKSRKRKSKYINIYINYI